MSAEIKTESADTAEVNMEELLLTKIKLNDGSMEFMFSRGPKYNEKLWPIQCHLCRVGYMVNEKKLRAHLNSEKHTTKLAEGPPDAEAYRKPYEQLYSDRMRLMNPIKIMPGEVIEEVTTQHSDRLMPCKQYNWENSPSEEVIEKLSKDDIADYNMKNAPILGLCYVFKMFDAAKKIKYYCSLCSSFFGEYNAYQHLVGIQGDHFNEYAKRHYSDINTTLVNLIDKNVNEADKRKWIENIIRNLYGKLETWKGYRKMHIVDGPLFDVHRQRYLSKARKLLHYSDQLVNFSDNELLELIQTCKSKGKLYPDDPQRLPNQPEPPTKAELEAEKKAEEQRKRKNDSNENNGPSKKSSRSDSGSRQRNGPKLDESPQNWAKYRNLVERALRSLNDEYGRFVDMSENHPQYRVEWTRFWRRRCLELREDNINPNDYDFMPEWNRFWIRYLEDCYESDVDKCKFEIRKTLRLPFRGRTPDPPGNNNRRGNNDNNNNNNSRSSLPQMSRGFDGHSGSGGGGGNNINNAGGNLNNSGGNRQTGPVPLMGIGTITPEPIHHQQQQQQQEIQIPTEPLSVLSVLRLLTALEDQLGSLGPTAIQLLSKAIFFEKETNSSANELLNENEYFKLFITALEKLKGQLLARIVPDMKIKAVTKAIEDLDTILNLFEEYKRRNQDKNQTQQQQQSAVSGGNNNGGGNNQSGVGSGGNQFSGNVGGGGGNGGGGNVGMDQWRGGNNKGIGTGDGDNRNQGFGSQFVGNSGGGGRDNSGMGGRSNWQTDNNSKANLGRDNSGGSNWRGSAGDDAGGANNFRDVDRQLGKNNNRGNDYEKKLQDNFSGQNRNNEFVGGGGGGGNSGLNSNRNDNYNSSNWNTGRNQLQSGYGNDSFGGNKNGGNLGGGGGMDLNKMDTFGSRMPNLQQMGSRNFGSPTGGGGGNSNFNSSYGYSTGGNSGNSGGNTGMFNRRY